MGMINHMRIARDTSPEYLLRYIKLRNHDPEGCIAVFEGNEDYSFYRNFLNPDLQEQINVLNVNGKDNVLNLRVKLSTRTESQSDKKVLYFIDKDFDGFKGHKESSNIYITPCYSIENWLVNERILKLLLKGEFHLNDGNIDDEKRVISFYSDRLKDFFEITREINQRLYYARINGLKANIDMSRFEYNLTVSEEKTFFKEYDPDAIIKITGEIDDYALEKSNNDFNKLDDLLDWRGKFLFSFFKKFLSFLKNDRGDKSPKIFSEKKAGININVDNSLVSILVSIARVPECFTLFIKEADEIINMKIL